jgi:hypothetical protein
MAGISSDAITAGRAEVAAAVDKRLEELVDAVMNAYDAEIEQYHNAFESDPSVFGEIRTTVRLNVAVAIQALAEGVELGDDAIGAIRQLARRRADQGIPIDAMERAYQVGMRISWQFALDEIRRLDLEPALAVEVLASTSVAIFSLVEQLTRAAAGSFLEAP